jgi:hypothetical protein
MIWGRDAGRFPPDRLSTPACEREYNYGSAIKGADLFP